MNCSVTSSPVIQLPQWTYSGSGTPISGQFTANDVPSLATQLMFSNTSKDGTSGWGGFFALLAVGSVIVLKGNICFAAKINSITTGGSATTVTFTSGLLSSTFSWAGDFSLSQWVPTLSGLIAGAGITPVADGTYTTGIGVTQNGTITEQQGITTAVQQAT